jgi:hypothetical protein
LGGLSFGPAELGCGRGGADPWTAGGTTAQAWSSSAQRRTGCQRADRRRRGA